MEWLLDVLWIIDDDWFLNLEPPWVSSSVQYMQSQHSGYSQ